MNPQCYFRTFPDAGPCEGRLTRAHLVKQQVLKREGHEAAIWDPRSWVWACGGITGCSGHHGMLDHSRRLRIPMNMLPPGFLELMEEIGMGWYVEREYNGARRT